MDKAEAQYEQKKLEKATGKELKKQVKELMGDSDKKVYSQSQYDEGVKVAAKQAATDAVKHLRELDQKSHADAMKLKDALKPAEKNKKSEGLEIEKAIEVAVAKETGGVDPKVEIGEDNNPWHGADIISSMKSDYNDPAERKLNAAAAAGIELARQSLESTKKKGK